MNDAAISLADYRTRMESKLDETLGDILYFTISEVSVTRQALETWFVELGLDERYLPNPLKAVDAFRKATGTEMRHTYKLAREGQTVTLFWRSVNEQGTDRVVRHLVREVRDSKAERLSHIPITEAIFYRPTRQARQTGTGGEKYRFSPLNVTGLEPVEDPEIKKFIAVCDERYHRDCSRYDTQALRAVVRDTIKDLNAVQMKRSGGLYFVHKSRRDTVLALDGLVKRFGGESSFHMIPLPDDPYQRAELTDSFSSAVEKECQSLLGKIAELNEVSKKNSGKVTAQQYANMNAELQSLMERSEEFTRVIGLSQGRAGAAIELAMDGVLALAGRIDPNLKRK